MTREDEIRDVCDWFERVLGEQKRQVMELMFRIENLESGLKMLREGKLLDARKKGEGGKVER